MTDTKQKQTLGRYAEEFLLVHDRYAAIAAIIWTVAWVLAIGICRWLADLDWAISAALAFAIGALGITGLAAYKNHLEKQNQERNSPTYQVLVNAVPVGTVTAAVIALIMDAVMQDTTVCMAQITNIAKAARRLTADVLVWCAVSVICAEILYILLAPAHLVHSLATALAMKPAEIQQASAHLISWMQTYIAFLVIARMGMGPPLGLANIYRQEWHNSLRVHLQCPASGDMTLTRVEPGSDHQRNTPTAINAAPPPNSTSPNLWTQQPTQH